MSFDLNYLRSGSGKTVIFQHGLGAQATQAQGLLAGVEGIDLISMDCRGHGKSVLPAQYTASFSAYCEDILRMMDHLNIERSIFGGISMGAGISMHMACYYPERVAGLILVRPAWLDQGNPPNLAILLELVPYLRMKTGATQFHQTPSFQQIAKKLPGAGASIMGQFLREQGMATPHILTHMVQDRPIDDLRLLHSIKQKTLVICNPDDPLHPAYMGERIAATIPDSRLITVTSRYIDDAAHKQKVRSCVSDFVNQLHITT